MGKSSITFNNNKDRILNIQWKKNKQANRNRGAGDKTLQTKQNSSKCEHVRTNENTLMHLIQHVETSAYTQFKLVEMRP